MPLKCKNMAGQDIAMNQFPVKTDCEYIYIELNGNQAKIKKTDLIKLLSSAFTILTLGDNATTDGSLWITGRYQYGIMAALGSRYSSGNVCILYGVRSLKEHKWVSTTDLNIRKFVYEFDYDGINVGTAPTASIPVGEEVQLTWKKISIT